MLAITTCLHLKNNDYFMMYTDVFHEISVKQSSKWYSNRETAFGDSKIFNWKQGISHGKQVPFMILIAYERFGIYVCNASFFSIQ